MILGFIIGIFVGGLTALINTLPFFTGLPSGVNSAFDFVHTNMAGLNDIFPLDTLITVFKLILIIELTIFTFKMFIWIYNKIRGSS